MMSKASRDKKKKAAKIKARNSNKQSPQQPNSDIENAK
jgi:hypothetical protein